jgi:Nif-specific regulatory protein
MIVDEKIALPARYRLDEVLKEGVETSVYLVRDLAERDRKALKVLKREVLGAQAAMQFRAEFTTLASLSHPNVIEVGDFGFLENRYPYFTMEYFPGRRITDFFTGQNWRELHDVLLQIARALHHIHHLGIVHFDLKPSNVMIGEGGRVKLMDFGVAASSHDILDRRIRGTLHYMAPEVLRQDRVDGRVDQYALGMTIYETITGALPTWGRPQIDVIRFQLDDDVRPPTAINPHVPPALERIVLRLLEKDPRHRYPNAAALFHDLADAAGVSATDADLVAIGSELRAAPVLGRDAEVAEVMAVVERARSGDGDGLIVAGAEGMGKGGVLREIILRAQLEGARIFVGRCPVNRKTIYAPFFDIFQQVLGAVNPGADAALEIRQLLTPVMVDEGDGQESLGWKYRLYNRLAQSIQDFNGVLNAESAASPLILVVEDLQWADPSTAELFTFLVGEARHSSLVVIGTLTTERRIDATPDEVVSREATAWFERAREHAIRILEIGPLSEDMVREYVEAILGEEGVPHELVRWVMWESGGSPLNIRRVIDYLIGRGYVVSTPDGWSVDMDRVQYLRIPGGAGAVWADKVDSLPGEHRAILNFASVLGEQFDIGLLAWLCDEPVEAVYGKVRRIEALGLLDELSDGTGFRFPQTSLRESIYGSMSERERAEAHQRAGIDLERRYLEGANELLGQVAYHFARGTSQEEAIGYSVLAAEQAATALAHEQAAEFYRVALELMDISGDEQRKPEIRERLGDAYFRSNNLRGAMQVYQFLLKSAQAHNGEHEADPWQADVMKKIGRILAKRSEWSSALSYFEAARGVYERHGRRLDVAEMLNRIAWIRIDKGDFAEAEKAGLEATALLDGMALSPALGYTKNILGVVSLARGELDRARSMFEDALAISKAIGSPQLGKVTTNNLAGVLYKLGEWDRSLEQHRRNLALSESDGDLWEMVVTSNQIATIEFGRGNFRAARELLERSLRITRKLGTPELEATTLESLGECHEMLGDWAAARDCYQRCLTTQGFDEERSARVSVYVPLARLHARTGDVARAMSYAQKAYETSERTRDQRLQAAASLLLAQIEQERENYPVAEKLLNEARDLFVASANLRGYALTTVIGGKRAFRERLLDDAFALAEEGAVTARRLGDRYTLAHADLLAGKVLFAKGSREEGEERFDRAQKAFEELDTVYEVGRLLFEMGLLRQDPEEASQALRRAIRIFEKLGAGPDLERARGAHFRIRPSGTVSDTSVVGLYEVVKIINSTLSVEEVLNRVLDIAIKRLRAERGMIMLIDPITGTLRTRVARNIREEVESARSPQAIIREVMQSGRSVISADARADARFLDSETITSENIVSTLCVPLVIRDVVAGAIYVDHREVRNLFSARDVNFLEAFADQSAIAIENARLYEEIEQSRMRLSVENESLRDDALVEKHLDSIVGVSEGVRRIQFTIRKAASSTSTVLVRGESGTGKGLVARIIHNVSQRRAGPFIKFNCAALPENLAESELFGHEKGSFTGADRRKPGRFELANGGTIFLDEVGKMSMAMQAKFLRVVEDKEFERVGGTVTLHTDVKIIAATNLDLEKAIVQGTFREDLFYRLNIIPIHMPPLRERKEDLESLAEYFIRKICRDLGIDPKRLEPGVMGLFATYDWPGNVRELEATLHRAIVMSSEDVLGQADFVGLLADVAVAAETPAPPGLPRDVLSPVIRRMDMSPELFEEVVARAEKQLIQQALQETGGKIREAARRLGLARNTLKAKMQKYGVEAASDGVARGFPGA